MGKAERNRAQRARERIAQQQAQARRDQRRRTTLIISGSIGLVIVVVVVFVIVAMNRQPAKQAGTSALPASVGSTLTTIPDSALAQVGTGALAPVSSLPIKSINGQALSSGGKPELLYIGAEFCPYCAAMRWATVIALSKFGTFGPFTGIHSAAVTPSGAAESYPNTATLTFLHQKYASQYLTFNPIENEDVKYQPLQSLTSAQQALWTKYEPGGQQGYPYFYFGGKVVITGPLYDPSVLKGLTWSQIANQLTNPKSAVSKNIYGAANYQIAAVCKMTGNAPASVCKAAPIPAIEASI